jgi:hypothetical protein
MEDTRSASRSGKIKSLAIRFQASSLDPKTRPRYMIQPTVPPKHVNLAALSHCPGRRALKSAQKRRQIPKNQ